MRGTNVPDDVILRVETAIGPPRVGVVHRNDKRRPLDKKGRHPYASCSTPPTAYCLLPTAYCLVVALGCLVRRARERHARRGRVALPAGLQLVTLVACGTGEKTVQ